MRNFVETANPFGLPTPPLFFLEALLVYDQALALYPSVEQAVYRVHRTLGRTSPIRWSMKMIAAHPDLLITEQLGGARGAVFSIQHHGLLDWGKVLLDIQERDTWAVHDPASILDHLDDLERETQARDIETELDARAADGWGLYQARTGASVSLAYSVPHGGQTGATPKHHFVPYRPFGAGTMFAGRFDPPERAAARRSPIV